MKNSVKVISLFLFLAVVILTTVKVSYNKPSEENPAGTSAAYYVKVTTNPPCYTGTCTATRVSDGAVFSMPYDVNVGGYYTSAPGLAPGTYTVTVCCGGRSGTGIGDIPNTATGGANIVVNLTGYCAIQEQD